MRVLIHLFIALLLFMPAARAADPVPKPGLNKTLILELLNAARKRGCQCGNQWYPSAPALTWNDQLEKAAATHATEMVQKKYFSHISSAGENAGDRIYKTGYNWKIYGENIGMGYRDEREMVEGWLKSAGHCKNIMDARFKEVGVAKVGNYWTQDFGAR